MLSLFYVMDKDPWTTPSTPVPPLRKSLHTVSRSLGDRLPFVECLSLVLGTESDRRWTLRPVVYTDFHVLVILRTTYFVRSPLSSSRVCLGNKRVLTQI